MKKNKILVALSSLVFAFTVSATAQTVYVPSKDGDTWFPDAPMDCIKDKENDRWICTEPDDK